MAGKTLEFVSIDRIARDARAANETMERICAIFKQEPLDRGEASIPGMMTEQFVWFWRGCNKCEVPIGIAFR
jgi:hypothetical protein